jgi:hypothetical protein
MSENIQIQLIDECYNCFNDGITKIGEAFFFYCLINKNN